MLAAICLLSVSINATSAPPEKAQGKEVVAVWEMSEQKGTSRITLFADHTTSNGKSWKVTPDRLAIGGGEFHLSPGKDVFIGRREGHSVTNGKLLMIGMAVESAPPASEKINGEKASKEESLLGIFQLTARTDKGRNKGRWSFSIPVEFTNDHRILDETKTIGNWDRTRRGVSIKFVDSRIGEATATIKNQNSLVGRSRSETNDQWSLSFERVIPVATALTNTLGEVTLYSNNYIDAPNGNGNRGYWMLNGNKMRLNQFLCTLEPNGKTFTGRGADAVRIEGKITSGHLTSK